MMFETIHEGVSNWGCPRLSVHGAGWLVDWYDARGNLTGSSVAQGATLAWLAENPDVVAETQRQVAKWLEAMR
jgi:hypothetical protein